MIAVTTQFKNHPCFSKHWSGLEGSKPITLIIGKNNTGKSHLLELVKALTLTPLGKLSWDIKAEARLDESSLKQAFPPGRSNSSIPGNYWDHHGVHYIGKIATWTKQASAISDIDLEEGELTDMYAAHERAKEFRQQCLDDLFQKSTHLLHGKQFKHLLADRDIQIEKRSDDLALQPNGTGATNIIRKFINSADANFPRELVQINLLKALNKVFGNDGHFLEITVQHHDSKSEDGSSEWWEINLKEEHKGLIPLSKSGSGLKTIFLVLLNLIVIPKIENKKVENYVFAFEELENNLHPSLLRRLLDYIQSYTRQREFGSTSSHPQVFLTTHSNVALDYFAGYTNAQIIHVSHDGKSARTHTVSNSANQLSILRDLGSKPSDLLQANGIIWVEGPSDRIYFNRWIELWSDGEYQEGRHYQCMFYGGGLLSNLQATSEEDATKELINLMKINPNSIVVSDSDKHSSRAWLKPRVKRIENEFADLDQDHNFHWILAAREVENYLTGDLINKVIQRPIANLEAPEQYESFFPKKSTPDESYMETKLNRKSFDKTDLAIATTPHMTKATLATRFDLDASMTKVISLIKTWNQ